MSRQVTEMSSLTRLDRRANLMRGLAERSWEELPDGTIRVEQRSPQFSLVRFFDDLAALAARDGYEVSVGGPWINVWRGGYRAGWKQVRRWAVLTPRACGTEGASDGE